MNVTPPGTGSAQRSRRGQPGKYSTLCTRDGYVLIVKLRRQTACFEDYHGFVVVFAQFRVCGTRKSHDTDFCERQPFRHPLRRIRRFAGDRRIGFETIASAGDVALDDVNGFSGQEVPAERRATIRRQLVIGASKAHIQVVRRTADTPQSAYEESLVTVTPTVISSRSSGTPVKLPLIGTAWRMSRTTATGIKLAPPMARLVGSNGIQPAPGR